MAGLRRIFEFERAAIIGGLGRDFAFRGKRGFHSDVDIVIDAPACAVQRLANTLGATRNRFGGFIYKDTRWKIDFWALETTWAAQNGHVTVSCIEDVASGTFFDCDAILYDLRQRKVHARDEYLDQLRA